jgi:hypothetical protein
MAGAYPDNTETQEVKVAAAKQAGSNTTFQAYLRKAGK